MTEGLPSGGECLERREETANHCAGAGSAPLAGFQVILIIGRIGVIPEDVIKDFYEAPERFFILKYKKLLHSSRVILFLELSRGGNSHQARLNLTKDP